MEKYLHLERLGVSEVNGILKGKVYIFSKIDGTSGRITSEEGKLVFGSRGRILDGSDNQGFKATMLSFYVHKLQALFEKNNVTLYGEFLKPHSIRYYKEDAWNKFYVYDVWSKGENRWLTYEEYQPIMEEFEVAYIPLMGTYENFNTETMNECLQNANFLLPEDKFGQGEGIVIKNYEFKNNWGRTVWAKIVQSEFKEMAQHKGKITKEINDYKNENAFVDNMFTETVIEKEIWKVINSNGGTFQNTLMGVVLKTTHDEIIGEANVNKDAYLGVDMRKCTSLAYMKIKKVLNDIVLPKLAM